MVTSGYGPRTAWHGCTILVWSNNSQVSTGSPRAMPVRATYGTHKGIFNVFHVLRDPYGACGDPQGCRTTPLRTRKGIDASRMDKIRHGPYFAVSGPYGPLRSPRGLFTSWLGYQNPYGARKLIMHTFKLYGPRTGRQNSYGTARVPCGPREWTYDFCSKQPGNTPYGARECDMTGASLVMVILPNSCMENLHGWYIYSPGAGAR